MSRWIFPTHCCVLALTLAGGLPLAAAQGADSGPLSPSRITQVTVYAGSATVERTASVAAGTRTLRLGCLPAALQPQQLQVSASDGVRIGEVQIQTLPRAQVPECVPPRQDAQSRLAQEVAELDAEIAATQLALGYLQSWTGNPAAEGTAGRQGGAAAGQNIATTLQTLRTQAQAQHRQLHALQTRREALEPQWQAMQASKDRQDPASQTVTQVRIQLAAAQAGQVQLRYQVNGPSWQPSYRAALDTRQSQVRLERLALVQQRTGEDWVEVPITLSTGQPQRASQPPSVPRWTLDVRLDNPPTQVMAMPAPAPAPMEMRKQAPVAVADMAAEVQSVQPVDTGHALQFQTRLPMTIASHGERTQLVLGEEVLPATLLVRTLPRRQTTAYLLAQFRAPSGIWPAAPVTLLRDGAYAGSATLQLNAADPLSPPDLRTLSFGSDDRVRVVAEPVARQTETTGLTGQTTETRTTLRYRIEHQHAQPIALQVVDAAPQSLNGEIRVESRYDPAPSRTTNTGAVVWEHLLAPGQPFALEAEHRVRHASDLQILERP